jgi:uncharacterized protein (TIGR02001 family)
MRRMRHLSSMLAGVIVCASATGATADGLYAEPELTSSAREFTYSFNLGVTSQYMFRGFSQTGGDPTMQGGVDLAYGMLYAGTWASGIRYGDLPSTGDGTYSAAEVDLYGGIRPTWGAATFDFGAIYYWYPAGNDLLVPLNYVELKAGVGGNITDALATGVTVYWSPDFSAGSGSVWTVEGSAAYTFHEIGMFTPSVTGTLGYQAGQEDYWKTLFANGDDSYLYWNAGLMLSVGGLSFDFRYWDTNLSNANGFCTGGYFQCDAQFVFTTKVALP